MTHGWRQTKITNRGLIRAAIGLMTTAAGVYLAVLAALAVRSGYSWAEMDWNANGTTSLGEFLAATDIAERPLRQDGQVCRELYRLKDGLPVRVECPLRAP